MTARDLIEDIFRRPQAGVVPNLRRITPAQLKYLRDLIEADPERASISRGAPGSLIWMPKGNEKYVLAEDLRGDKHTLTRLRNVVPTESGLLF